MVTISVTDSTSAPLHIQRSLSAAGSLYAPVCRKRSLSAHGCIRHCIGCTTRTPAALIRPRKHKSKNLLTRIDLSKTKVFERDRRGRKFRKKSGLLANFDDQGWGRHIGGM